VVPEDGERDEGERERDEEEGGKLGDEDVNASSQWKREQKNKSKH
jgi:hypothetical protein